MVCSLFLNFCFQVSAITPVPQITEKTLVLPVFGKNFVEIELSDLDKLWKTTR